MNTSETRATSNQPDQLCLAYPPQLHLIPSRSPAPWTGPVGPLASRTSRSFTQCDLVFVVFSSLPGQGRDSTRPRSVTRRRRHHRLRCAEPDHTRCDDIDHFPHAQMAPVTRLLRHGMPILGQPRDSVAHKHAPSLLYFNAHHTHTHTECDIHY